MKKNYFSHFLPLFSLSFLFFVFLSESGHAQVQTLTKRPNIIYKTTDTVVGGYLESLPINHSDTTKKFPLIISLHGSGGLGNGTSAQLDNILNESGTTIPKRIANGTFPTYFTVDDKTFSFIVISPQFKTQVGATYINGIKAMIDTCKKLYRVDTSRIYVTGSSLGGAFGNGYVATNLTNANQIAASVLVCPSNVNPAATPSFYARGNIIGTSNLPLWILSNYGDNLTPRGNLQLYVDTINLFTPSPLAKLTLHPVLTNTHDAWTTTYNPDSTWSGVNVYQWMLRYTNKKLVANAGTDQAITFPGNSTVTLNGTRSTARQGRITAYLWTKISGPSAGTITNSTDSITTVTGIDTGSYRFELKVTHTDASIARDTVVISTQTQTAVSPTPAVYTTIGGFYQSLPVTYDSDSTKKFPLIIFSHASAEMGNGTSDLSKLLTNGLPKLIKEGAFPASVVSGGKSYSFIVLSPQYSSTGSNVNAVKAMIDYAVSHYRVDTTRIYLTGIGQGGLFTWSYSGTSKSYANRLAAALLVRPNVDPATTSSASDTVAASNLPLWVTHATGDLVAAPSKAQKLVDSVNLRNPNPLAKISMITTTSGDADAWTKTYNPLSKFWADSINVYQWMLSYTRPQSSPRKSKPAADVTKPTTEVSSEVLDATLNPNPVRSQVTIWVTGKAKGKSSITIYSLQGQRLAQQQFIKNSQEKVNRTFNVTGYPGGTYVVQVIVDGRYKRVLQFIK